MTDNYKQNVKNVNFNGSKASSQTGSLNSLVSKNVLFFTLISQFLF